MMVMGLVLALAIGYIRVDVTAAFTLAVRDTRADADRAARPGEHARRRGHPPDHRDRARRQDGVVDHGSYWYPGGLDLDVIPQ